MIQNFKSDLELFDTFCLKGNTKTAAPRSLEGIHYEAGKMIASNAKIMVVQYNCTYPAEYEGKTIRPDTKEQFMGYPDWRKVVNKALGDCEIPVKVDRTKLDGILRYAYVQEDNSAGAVLKIYKNFYVSLEQFTKLVSVMDFWNWDTILLPEISKENPRVDRPLMCCAADGCAILMPAVPTEKGIPELKNKGLYYEL